MILRFSHSPPTVNIDHCMHEYEYVADRGPVFPGGASPPGASSDPRPCSPLRGCMDYDVVDVDEEESRPVLFVRPGAKQPYPVSGSASTGGSSGRGDAAGPPDKCGRKG